MNNNYFTIRHGSNNYKEENEELIYPWPEPSPILLTERGIKEVKDSLKKIKKARIDLIYSSDIPRTKQTAEIISEELGLEVIFDKRLRDTDFGIFAGKHKNDYFSFFADPIERFTRRPPEGESWNDVRERVIGFLKDIDKKYRNKNILLVSHADPIWLLGGMAAGLEDKELLKEREEELYPKTGDFFKIDFKQHEF